MLGRFRVKNWRQAKPNCAQSLVRCTPNSDLIPPDLRIAASDGDLPKTPGPAPRPQAGSSSPILVRSDPVEMAAEAVLIDDTGAGSERIAPSSAEPPIVPHFGRVR